MGLGAKPLGCLYMVKFAHLGDCHLGSWRQPELQELNFQSFERAIDEIIKQRLDFVLIAGDLFDSAYPPIEILKRAFGEFRKLKEAGIKTNNPKPERKNHKY